MNMVGNTVKRKSEETEPAISLIVLTTIIKNNFTWPCKSLQFDADIFLLSILIAEYSRYQQFSNKKTERLLAAVAPFTWK